MNYTPSVFRKISCNDLAKEITPEFGRSEARRRTLPLG